MEQQRLEDERLMQQEVDKEIEQERKEQLNFKLRGQVQKQQDYRVRLFTFQNHVCHGNLMARHTCDCVLCLSSRQARVDEIRARRAYEEGQRKERQRELEAARRRKAIMEEVKRTRDWQLEQREMQLAFEVQGEKEEFAQNQRLRDEWMEEEARARQRRREADLEHARQLREENYIREERRRKEREETRREGDREMQQRQAQLERLQRLRERKLRELQGSKVHPRYTVQLANFDPSDAIKKDYKRGTKGAK